MGLERRNPLPAGRYWIYLEQERGGRTFDAWRMQVGAELLRSSLNADGWTWYLFRTTAPAEWDASQWGWPNTAAPNVMSETDAVQLPPPQPGVIDSIDQALDKSKSTLLTTVVLVGVGLLLVNRLIR